jgi:hypothetical protein
MAKICYRETKFQAKTLAVIDLANEIIVGYEAIGFTLTLRQLYYQFVARNALSNNEKSYKNLPRFGGEKVNYYLDLKASD